jgi:deoxyribodipyrimidine photo-lyase
MKRILVWFRNDLRLHDNPALSAACAQADEVIAYYCFDSQYYGDNKSAFPRIGARRAQFILESLQDLKESLASLNIPLQISIGKPWEGIKALHQNFPVDAIFYSEEYAYEEIMQADELKSLDIPLQSFGANLLFDIAELPFPLYKLPRGFSTFRKKIEAVISPAVALSPPQSPQSTSPVNSTPLPSLIALGLRPDVIDERAALKPKGGEKEGLNRLHYYLFTSKNLSQYKETRNGMIGGDYSSKFSFWLANGSLSPRKIYQEIKDYEAQFGANESTYWLYFELLWREFFRLNAAKKGANFFQMPLPYHSSVDAQFEKWRQGKTGHSFIDANMRELALTGFMSNRGRQNVASYLINNLKGDWRLGAAWFESALIDYDVYSNYGNWTYLAGNGNDPRGQRSFNINSQQERYDPNGDYVNLWLNF